MNRLVCIGEAGPSAAGDVRFVDSDAETALLASGQWLPACEWAGFLASSQRRHRSFHADVRAGGHAWRDQWDPSQVRPRLAGRLRPRYTPGAAQGTGGGYKRLCAFIQYVGTGNYVADVLAGPVSQHVDAQPNEMLLIVFEVARLLIQTDPAHWVSNAAIPNTIAGSVTLDAGTGLYQMFAGTGGVWGVMRGLGQPYFEAETASAEDGARFFIVGGVLEIVPVNQP